MLENEDTNSIEVMFISKCHAKIFLCWRVVKVPQSNALDVIDLVAIHTLVDCVLIIFNIYLVLHLKR